MAHAPPAQGIKAQHYKLAFGSQYPVHFAQHVVRIRAQFKRMRQQNRINAIRRYGQPLGQRTYIHRISRLFRNNHGRLCTRKLEQFAWWPPIANLHNLVTENALQHQPRLLALRLQQSLSRLAIQPPDLQSHSPYSKIMLPAMIPEPGVPV